MHRRLGRGRAGGLTGTLKAGSAVLLLPFRPFTLAPQDGDALRCRSVHFLVEPVYLERTLCGISREAGKLVFPLSDTGRMEELLDIGIRQMDARQFGGTILLQAAIMLALRDLIPEKVCAAAAEKYPVTQNQADLIERAVELAMAGMDRPLRVNAMIKALETSESRLNKTFNEIMGTSPSRYFMGLKIRLAEELINTSNLTLELVARILGSPRRSISPGVQGGLWHLAIPGPPCLPRTVYQVNMQPAGILFHSIPALLLPLLKNCR